MKIKNKSLSTKLHRKGREEFAGVKEVGRALDDLWRPSAAALPYDARLDLPPPNAQCWHDYSRVEWGFFLMRAPTRMLRSFQYNVYVMFLVPVAEREMIAAELARRVSLGDSP